jgi:hypothetical protein
MQMQPRIYFDFFKFIKSYFLFVKDKLNQLGNRCFLPTSAKEDCKISWFNFQTADDYHLDIYFLDFYQTILEMPIALRKKEKKDNFCFSRLHWGSLGDFSLTLNIESLTFLNLNKVLTWGEIASNA